MKFLVKYNGAATRFKNFEEVVEAPSKRDAVEEVYIKYFYLNYFLQENGDVLDKNGYLIADSDDDEFQYDGGYFYAVEVTEEKT